jgi:hypothetical protein
MNKSKGEMLNRPMVQSDRLPCLCCERLTVSERGGYEICGLCGWEDDPVQAADPAYAGGANLSSLNEARETWRSRISAHRNLPDAPIAH